MFRSGFPCPLANKSDRRHAMPTSVLRTTTVHGKSGAGLVRVLRKILAVRHVRKQQLFVTYSRMEVVKF